ncbi:RagB/SusD family nutrient uptake outer membrane protein [Neolewinella lacunae]|uniref:RagB/SusD family nutrient uptake outer membrane protein n=1 Tax=Neolewinella lacunae TaxID=1517758 RepID=A0A923T9Y9_9BACT|nr:RagB/SusD family nutrient uptake outer membrane protein [Neolewinella lacunae]MBC6995578.1 RagB/SusD family nutrient uptake outer membrane protein [Neolewinella lacunae]MDN3635614.1 RagB/SusD family nutrient uptake outer membrane protein [Neolewinella lacunae]
MKSNYLSKGIIATVAFSFFAFNSCTDLQVEEIDSVVIESSGGASAGDPAQLIEAAYNDLSVFTDQANLYSLFQHPSDEMIPPTRGVDWGDNGVWRTLHAHSWDPTHEQVLNAWNALNQRIFKTAEILASNPNAEQAAQANFLQGFYIWHVLDLYGQVPFREFDEGVDVLPRVLSRSEALNRAIERVEGAISNLPSVGPGENIRGSKAAAYAILTRMYLNKAVYTAADPAGPYQHDPADLDKVIQYADLLTAEGYEFDDDYFSIWEVGTDKEPILVSNQGSGQNRWMMTLHYSQNPSGWNGFTTISDFYDQWDQNDPRFGRDATPDGTAFSGIGVGMLQGQQFDDNGNIIIDTRTQMPLQFTEEVKLAGAPTAQGIRVIKYHPARASKYIILRYAEAQLNKAEAQLRKGDSAGALATINAMRTARGGATLGSIDEAAMLAERSFETYWEGLRRIDQVRFGTFTDSWTEKTSSDPTRVLFPIPQQALDSNPNLQQNPGY